MPLQELETSEELVASHPWYSGEAYGEAILRKLPLDAEPDAVANALVAWFRKWDATAVPILAPAVFISHTTTRKLCLHTAV